MTDSIPGGPLPGDHDAAAAGPGSLPPPPPPPGSAPPLTRSRTDRYIAGVCGGLGAHFHVDPLIFRIGFAALTFAGGAGLVLYVLAWVLVPEEGSAHRIGWDSMKHIDRHNTRLLAAALLTVLAVVLFADNLHFAHEGAIWGVALVGAGVLLLLQERREPVPGFHPATTAEPPAPYAAAAFNTAPLPAPGPQPMAVRVSRPRSILGLLTAAAALLAVGVAALLDSTGVVSVSVAAYLAVVLIIVGAGLIAGGWFGRSRALIALGILLIPFTAAAALVDEPLSGGTGNVAVTPQSLADLRGHYTLAAGQLTVDLSQLSLSANRTVSASVALGHLVVVVPAQADLDIHAHAGAGHINLLGAADDGVNIDSPLSRSPNGGGGTLHLDLRVGFGEVEVVYPSGAPANGQ
jgi:phage shock protein PspC (stress-responsive transcriptional regulator)